MGLLTAWLLAIMCSWMRLLGNCVPLTVFEGGDTNGVEQATKLQRTKVLEME